MTFRNFKFDGIEMPTPAIEGVVATLEPVWSDDTGRVTSGKMEGHIVAVKHKYQLKWTGLTPAQGAKLYDFFESGKSFFTVSCTDPTGKNKTFKMYAGTSTFAQYSWADGIQWIKEASVDLIEQ